jgi:hypothetical protein
MFRIVSTMDVDLRIRLHEIEIRDLERKLRNSRELGGLGWEAERNLRNAQRKMDRLHREREDVIDEIEEIRRDRKRRERERSTRQRIEDDNRRFRIRERDRARASTSQGDDLLEVAAVGLFGGLLGAGIASLMSDD